MERSQPPPPPPPSCSAPVHILGVNIAGHPPAYKDGGPDRGLERGLRSGPFWRGCPRPHV